MKGGVIHGDTDEVGYKAVEHPHFYSDLQRHDPAPVGLDYRNKEYEFMGRTLVEGKVDPKRLGEFSGPELVPYCNGYSSIPTWGCRTGRPIWNWNSPGSVPPPLTYAHDVRTLEWSASSGTKSEKPGPTSASTASECPRRFRPSTIRAPSP